MHVVMDLKYSSLTDWYIFYQPLTDLKEIPYRDLFIQILLSGPHTNLAYIRDLHMDTVPYGDLTHRSQQYRSCRATEAEMECSGQRASKQVNIIFQLP